MPSSLPLASIAYCILLVLSLVPQCFYSISFKSFSPFSCILSDPTPLGFILACLLSHVYHLLLCQRWWFPKQYLFFFFFYILMRLWLNFFFLFLNLFISKEREREGKKHQCVVASCVPPTGVLACNPGMCPDWESNWWPFSSQARTQSTEPQQPGPKIVFLNLIVSQNSCMCIQPSTSYLSFFF